MEPQRHGILGSRGIRPLSAVLCTLIALSTPTASANAPQKRKKDPPPKIEPWLGDFDAAVATARDRNTPLVVFAILEGEMTSDRVRDEIFKGSSFNAAAAPTVVLLVNDGDHPPKKIEEERKDGETIERQVCSVYGVPTCADHRRSWKRVYQEYNQKGDMKVPALLAVLPDGTKHGDLRDEIQLDEAVRLVNTARKRTGKPLTVAELREVKGKLESGTSFAKAKLWHESWRSYARVLEITEAPRYAGRAQAGVEAALAGMQADIDQALARMGKGEVEAGYGKLVGLREPYAGTPLEKALKSAIRKAELNKEWKDAIKAYKRVQEAEKIWTEVQVALGDGKQKAAERLARNLLRRFADTPAGKRAAERFPHLVEEG